MVRTCFKSVRADRPRVALDGLPLLLNPIERSPGRTVGAEFEQAMLDLLENLSMSHTWFYHRSLNRFPAQRCINATVCPQNPIASQNQQLAGTRLAVDCVV
jgi:hypothetical protein